MVGYPSPYSRAFASFSILLQPANPDLQPIMVDKQTGDIEIQGVVIGILRKY